jgi:hypothetical protein
MQTGIQNEADELLQSASRAISSNDSLLKLQMMNEVQTALEKLINMHPHSPYSIAMCSFLLGAYMGLSYNNMKKFEE